MKVKFKNGSKTVYPKKWLEDNFKNGNIKIETLFNYNRTISFFNTDMDYDLIFKDDEYVLIKNYLGSVICCRVEDIKTNNINIGDKVKITDVGEIYSTYWRFFIENQLSYSLLGRYQYKRGDIDTKEKYIVEHIGEHIINGNKVCVISEDKEDKDGKVFLIGIDGVELS